jgi:hypothetical protein
MSSFHSLRILEKAHIDEIECLQKIISEFKNLVGKDGWSELPEPDASLSTDITLQDIVSSIRTRYLLGVAELTAKHWRTPVVEESVPFLGNDKGYFYAYDRQHPPKLLEERSTESKVTGLLLCSSGMSALNVTFQGIAHLLRRPRKLIALASYFETFTLLRISAFSSHWERANSVIQLVEILSHGDIGVIFLEPVRYDWSLATEDWDILCEAMAQLDNPPIIIADTTLCSKCDALESLLQRLKIITPLLVMVRSGIKLDQHGLELANLGVIEWYLHPCSDRSFSKLKEIFSACRVVLGATLTWPDACALAPSFVLNNSSFKDFSSGVFATNRLLYNKVVRCGGLFEDIIHPEMPWPAPFVLFKLRIGGHDNYRELAKLISREQLRRGLHWKMSGSFGFRSAHYETILPEEQVRPNESPVGVLKIAAGRYAGAQLHSIIDLLNELAEYNDIQQVKRAWSRQYLA